MAKRKRPPPAPPQRMRGTRTLVVAVAAVAILGAAAWWMLRRAPPSHPNLLLITIDTLRADHVGAYGATTGATPVLDALAAAGVRFNQVQTAVPLTGPSHATILTGQYPPVHGVRGNVVFTLGTTYPTLATLLKRQGYRTAAFVGAYPVAAAFGFSQGFDTFDEEFHESLPGEQGAERRANEVADAAIRWLDLNGPAKAGPYPNSRTDAPFFTWLHFYDPHAPYDPPSPYRERFSGRPYDGEIAFTDAQIGRVLDRLRASGLDTNTVIVVLADHGEGLGDHHERTHGVLIYQSTMRVPMIVAGPGVPAAREVPNRVATIDVLPTAMSLLGFGTDRTLFGRDLRPLMAQKPIADDPLYAESLFGRLNCHWATLRGWAKADWKLISGAEPELYNLAQDPGEQSNLAAAEGDRVRRMTDELQRGLQRLAPRGDEAKPNPITADQEERLRSLGYAAGSGGSGALDDPRLPDPKTHVELYDRLQAATVASGPALARAFDDVVAITRLDPNNPFAFGTLASMAYQHGSLVVAADAFARTLEIDPDRPGVRQNYGKLLRELGHGADSERELRIALAQSGEDDPQLRISLAETLTALNKTGEADALIAAVLAREPKNPGAQAAKGHLLLAQGRPAEALPYFEQAATSSDVESSIELARAYLAAGRTEKAREAATEALRQVSGHPWAMAVLGRALVLEGQHTAGVEYLQRALAAGPRRPAVWQSLAEGFESAGDAALAASCRREAATIVNGGDSQKSNHRAR
jgi:arylsulfatase A-like enzyme/predicted Zn-dependent protease